MTIPGFVQLGALAVLFQLLVVVGFHGYLRYRHPIADPEVRRRVVRVLVGGGGLVAFGQLAALGAVGSLWVTSLLSLEQALVVQDAGLLITLVGYLGIFAGFVVHGRATG